MSSRKSCLLTQSWIEILYSYIIKQGSVLKSRKSKEEKHFQSFPLQSRHARLVNRLSKITSLYLNVLNQRAFWFVLPSHSDIKLFDKTVQRVNGSERFPTGTDFYTRCVEAWTSKHREENTAGNPLHNVWLLDLHFRLECRILLSSVKGIDTLGELKLFPAHLFPPLEISRFPTFFLQ